MTAFELGFVEQAKCCGISFKKASHMLKRALEHPEAQRIFKELPEDKQKENEDISFLADILNQDAVDKKIQKSAEQLQQY